MNKKDLQKEIREYISSNTENPSDVIKDATDFICSILERSTYAIFQSDFGFMDTDTPFTMIVEKVTKSNDDITYQITYWSVDWSSFNILEPDWIHVAEKWDIRDSVKKDIPEWDTLTAKEIIEHPKFKDKIFYGETTESTNLFQSVHYTLHKEYGWNSLDEDEDDYDYPCNPKTSGIVAVLYRES